MTAHRRDSWLRLGLGIALLLCFGCLVPRSVSADVVPIEGTISTDTAWVAGNVYLVTNDLTIAQNTTLTVESGVVVKFRDWYDSLIVNGALRVLGTAESPVCFTSWKDDTVGGDTNGDGGATRPQADDWGGIQFNDESNDAQSLIEHAVIRYGGGDYIDGGVYLTSASPTIRSSVLTHNAPYAISADVASQPVLSDLSFSDNGSNGLGIRGGTITGATNWDQTGVTYILADDVFVAHGAVLTVHPGVVVKFRDWYDSLIVNGALRVLGTAESPVYFTSWKDDTVGGDTNGDGGATRPQADDWGGIQFNDESNDAQSLIEHAVIRYGGGDYIDGGVYLTSASPTIRSSVLTHNAPYAISADVASQPVLSDLGFSDNGSNGLGIRGGTITSATNWDQTGVTYILADDVFVAHGAMLTVHPGVVVKPRSYYVRLVVNGVLRVLGTDEAPAYFTSWKDDAVGGDTNGDGGATRPQAGDWSGIQFNDESDDAQSLIENTVIRYGGSYPTGGVYLVSASPTIRHSELANNVYGLRTMSGSTPILECNAFHDNTNHGVYNADAATVVNAAGNWWGSASGPYHATSNPAGSGDRVSDGVNYSPWLTAPCGDDDDDGDGGGGGPGVFVVLVPLVRG